MTKRLLDLPDSPLVKQEIDESIDGSLDATGIAVLETVAAVSDSEVTDLPPLYESIDPDSLHRLFRTTDLGVCVFPYDSYLVCVTAEGTISVFDQHIESPS